MNNTDHFRMRSYSKTELALMYSPCSSPQTALQCLTRWIKHCRPLMDELRSMGYNKFRHTLLRQEVEAIVRHLGEP